MGLELVQQDDIQYHLIQEIKRLSNEIHKLNQNFSISQTKVTEDITRLKIAQEGIRVKGTLWGMVGASIPTSVGVLYILLKHG